MTTWIAFFRGINVGGNNLLPMAKLRVDLEQLKLKNVRTYIQSGNVIFDSPIKTAATLAKKIAAQVETEHGFRPPVFVLKRDELQETIQSNPFPHAVADPKTLHVFFLGSQPAKPNLPAIEAAKKPTEQYELADRVFYLHAPDGIGRSKLAANVEKYLGVVATARNYRTIDKLLLMVT
ncbi:DUF1697 domain-containing protein [Planctomycetes bacterium K23_9]|uniref:DUF1697 domain-containing protein n=1 Tax=Stieleria marina TaxID=1930275 RepID=A0A517NLU5_9BACT|nr:hypothetical protein K239x_00350 [Planctomycetes bacterium K23_9]